MIAWVSAFPSIEINSQMKKRFVFPRQTVQHYTITLFRNSDADWLAALYR